MMQNEIDTVLEKSTKHEEFQYFMNSLEDIENYIPWALVTAAAYAGTITPAQLEVLLNGPHESFIEAQRAQCVIGLIESGFDLTVLREDTHETLLMFAAKRNYPRVAELLIKHDVNINLTDINGYTALHYAIKNKQIEITRLLLSQPEIDVNLSSRKNETPLTTAARFDCRAIPFLLAHHADTHSVTHRQMNALITAIKYSAEDPHIEEAIRCLLDAGTDLNFKDVNDEDALLISMRCSNPKIVRIMLKAHGLHSEFSDKFLFKLRKIVPIAETASSVPKNDFVFVIYLLLSFATFGGFALLAWLRNWEIIIAKNNLRDALIDLAKNEEKVALTHDTYFQDGLTQNLFYFYDLVDCPYNDLKKLLKPDVYDQLIQDHLAVMKQREALDNKLYKLKERQQQVEESTDECHILTAQINELIRAKEQLMSFMEKYRHSHYKRKLLIEFINAPDSEDVARVEHASTIAPAFLLKSCILSVGICMLGFIINRRYPNNFSTNLMRSGFYSGIFSAIGLMFQAKQAPEEAFENNQDLSSSLSG